jgi:3-oxoacyl-[acyl-carrier-protein] synthase-3
MRHSRIVGTGFHVPEHVVTNDDLSKVMDTTDEWIRARTGIQERHWVQEGETGAELAKAAAGRALDMAGLTPQDLDAIVYATSTPDHYAPGGGVFLQRIMGVSTIPAMDIHQACSGFVYSLSVADAWIRAGHFQRILVVGAEIQSTAMDVTSRGRNTSVIFADGAGAVVLVPTEAEEQGLLAFDLHSQGEHAELLWVDTPGCMYHPRITHEHIDAGRHFLQMDGKEVFRHAVTRMPETVRTVLGKLGAKPEDLALLLPHQANLRISEMVQRELKLRDDQVYNNIQRYGNTTAATIPIMLDECVRSGRVKMGDLLVMTAFGAGFSWGSVACRW